MTIQPNEKYKTPTNSKRSRTIPIAISCVCVGFPTTLWLFFPQKLRDMWLWLTSLDHFSLIALIILSILLSIVYIFKLAIDAISKANKHAPGKNVFSVKLFGKEFVTLETDTKSSEIRNNLHCISPIKREDAKKGDSNAKDDNITERTAQSS